MDFEFQKCPIFGSSLQIPAASNQKGFYTEITQNSSVYLGFDAEVSQKILQWLYFVRLFCNLEFITLKKHIHPHQVKSKIPLGIN